MQKRGLINILLIMTSLIIFFDTGIEVDDYQLISGGPETDFSNAKILYEALQGQYKFSSGK